MKFLNSSFFFLLFLSRLCSAQVDEKFIEHLKNNQLKAEHYTYLNNLKTASDSTSFYKAKFYLLYFNDSLFTENIVNCKNLIDFDTVFQIESSLRFLVNNGISTNSEMYRVKWFSESNIEKHSVNGRTIKFIYEASERPLKYSNLLIPEGLHQSFSKYKKASAKSPFLGAVFSSVVPGLGKLYAGKRGSAIATFLLNAGYAVQSAESIHKLGLRHPLSVINVCAFTAFYAANIYGGFHSVRQSKQELKKQFLVDAANFYN